MYVGPVVIYKIIDPYNYLLITLDGKILRGLFGHERLKPTNIRTSQGNVCNLAQLKQIINVGLMLYNILLLINCYIGNSATKSYIGSHE